MDDTSELGAIAQKCRRLADAISDGAARDNLQCLAADYEQRAELGVEQVARSDDAALMPWAGQG